MFPVSNLRDFYESEGRENVMGSGMVHDYNQKLAGDAVIYGDIVSHFVFGGLFETAIHDAL